MENNEKLIAIENIIYGFIQTQFAANDITPAEAAILIEAICGKVQRHCLDSIIMGMVSIDQGEENRGEDHTGTVEDLKRALDKAVTEKNCAAE